MNRTEILKKANECVTGSRQQDYGSAERNFELIANLWSTYLDTDISAVDVAMMMSMLKIARIKSGRLHEDNFIDLAGYAACAGEIAHRETDSPRLERIKKSVPDPMADVVRPSSPSVQYYNRKLIETAKKHLKSGKSVEMSAELFKAFCGKLYEEACNEP